MTPTRWRLLAGAALFVAVAAPYLSAAGGRMVLDADEALYVAAANGMAATGDWVTPRVNGVRFLDKPPLLYWLLASLERLFGPGELGCTCLPCWPCSPPRLVEQRAAAMPLLPSVGVRFRF